MRGFLLTHLLEVPVPRRHQIDEYAALFEAAGIPASSTVPTWRLVDDDESGAAVAALLDEAGCKGDRPLVGLHLGAAFGSSKQWAPEAFAELAGRLRDRGLQPVLIGGPADTDMAARIATLAGDDVPSTVGRDRPSMLPRLLSHLNCLVASDTGVAHLGAALGVATITLFGPTDPRLTAPRGRAVSSLEGPAPCAPCFLPRCPIDHVCMRAISAAAVAQAVEQVRAA